MSGHQSSSSASEPVSAASTSSSTSPSPHLDPSLTQSQQALAARIVDHAAHRFLQEGFHRVTMDEVSHALGISKRTLYETIPGGKEPLVEMVMMKQIKEITGMVEEVMENDSLGFDEKFERFLLVIGRGISRVSRAFLTDLQRFQPKTYRIMMKVREENVQRYFRQLLEEGKAQGAIRADVDPKLTAEAFLQMIQGLTRHEVMERLEITPEQAFRTGLRMVMHGVLEPGWQDRRGGESA